MEDLKDMTASDRDLVVLTIPAESGYLAVLRTAAAGLAARLQFTLDEIEDLRTAVDEACRMLIRLAPPAAELACRFMITDADLTVEVAAPSRPGAVPPGPSSFAWQLLASLTSAAAVEVDADRTARIALRAQRSPR